MKLKKIFEKQGGVKLIKQYWHGGALFTAIIEFLLLGRDRTGLEILRLSAQLKTKQKLQKKYKEFLDEFDTTWNEKEFHKTSKNNKKNVIWMCWFQGIENAPLLVQRCYESIKRNIPDREIILITTDNMMDYVEFPTYIQSKIDNGIIKGAHLSDLLRLNLLLKYGGTWIDGTVYCSDCDIPSYMLESELFLYQNLKPGKDGHCTVISNWFITASENNKLLAATQALLYKYWEKNDDLIDYFIFHIFFQIVIERYNEEWNRVVPVSNSTPHIILLRLFEQYDEQIWSASRRMTPFHKLSYKFEEEDIQKENTFYQAIMKMH